MHDTGNDDDDDEYDESLGMMNSHSWAEPAQPRFPGLIEANAGNLSGAWQGEDAAEVQLTEAKDGDVCVYLSADWDGLPSLDCPDFVNLRIKVRILEGMLQCSAVIVLRGAQCGPLHLDLVVHVKDWLWTRTPPSLSKREVEGFGSVDYLNILWAIESKLELYRHVSAVYGMCRQRVLESDWDGFWYIYRRDDETPSYSHMGIDMAATLSKQTHVAAVVVTAIEASARLAGEALAAQQGQVDDDDEWPDAN